MPRNPQNKVPLQKPTPLRKKSANPIAALFPRNPCKTHINNWRFLHAQSLIPSFRGGASWGRNRQTRWLFHARRDAPRNAPNPTATKRERLERREKKNDKEEKKKAKKEGRYREVGAVEKRERPGGCCGVIDPFPPRVYETVPASALSRPGFLECRTILQRRCQLQNPLAPVVPGLLLQRAHALTLGNPRANSPTWISRAEEILSSECRREKGGDGIQVAKRADAHVNGGASWDDPHGWRDESWWKERFRVRAWPEIPYGVKEVW